MIPAHLKNYQLRKARDEVETCLNKLSYNWETVAGRIRNGLNCVPLIDWHLKSVGIILPFDERNLFSGINIIESKNTYPYPFSGSDKINYIHWKKKHKMLGELNNYCVRALTTIERAMS